MVKLWVKALTPTRAIALSFAVDAIHIPVFFPRPAIDPCEVHCGL